MNNLTLTPRKLFLGAVASCLLAVGQGAMAAEPNPGSHDFAFTVGQTGQLDGVKRVVISNFAIAFQLEGSLRKDNATTVGSTTFFGRNTKEVAAKMAWQKPDTAMMQDIADAGLAALKAEFRAKGIEVLDESVLANQAAYASILEASGLKSLDDYSIVSVPEATFRNGNTGGEAVSDAKLVSAKGVTPYGHSVFEGGLCCHVRKGYPSSKVYYVPGFEIDLAKALDAVVVKVWQYVYFTQLDAGVRQEGWAGGVGGATVNFNASAKSALRIGEQKTRMAFRLPTSTNRTRNTPTTWLPNDGDVVVNLSKPLWIGDEYFSIADSGATSGQEIRASLGGAQYFNFSATLSNPAAYQKDVVQALKTVLTGLVSTALGPK